ERPATGGPQTVGLPVEPPRELGAVASVAERLLGVGEGLGERPSGGVDLGEGLESVAETLEGDPEGMDVVLGGRGVERAIEQAAGVRGERREPSGERARRTVVDPVKD